MSYRRLLNVVYAVLADARKESQEALDALDRQLAAKFDHELTPGERRREEARRMLEAKGAVNDQQGLMEVMARQGMRRG